MPDNPVGVFDSGLGGLSVVRHLRRLLPHEDIVYFGDTARVPYGAKSRRTVLQFARDDARFLLQFEPKLIVAACNTVSALALEELAAEMPVPTIGVVEPGAAAAVEAAQGGLIVVLGTEATISSEAYVTAIRAIAPQARVMGRACPLLVPLVEEGRDSSDPIVRLTIETYLADVQSAGARAVVLGCTHYPLLAGAIGECLGPDVTLIDSGRETSLAVQAALRGRQLLSTHRGAGTIRYCVSDNPARFRRVGSRFLEHEIGQVELVEMERYVSSAMPVE